MMILIEYIDFFVRLWIV